jgi:hypothetical protein
MYYSLSNCNRCSDSAWRGAHYWGLSGVVVFLVMLIAIFLATVLIPWKKEKNM